MPERVGPDMRRRGKAAVAALLALLVLLAVASRLELVDRLERLLEGNPTVTYPEDPSR